MLENKEIICPVCNKKCKDKLAYSIHLKNLSVKDKLHKEYKESILQKIKNNFKEKTLSEMSNELNLSCAWISRQLRLFFTNEEIKEVRKKLKLKRNEEKKFLLKKETICPICKNTFYSYKGYPKTCSKQCKKQHKKNIFADLGKRNKGKNYLEIHGEEKSKKIKEKIIASLIKSNPQIENSEKLFCECGKFRYFKKGTIEKYICRSCKSKSFKYELKCANCQKTIYRYKKEVNEVRNEVKHPDGPRFFCSRKCVKEFFNNNPERYKDSRIKGGLSSVQSFRNRGNFEYNGVKFSSATEMKCAQFLEKELGLELVERKTCHVIINNIEVDFLYKNFVIEYHQCHRKTELSLKERIKIFRERKFRYEYRTLEEYYKSRNKKLPKGYKLIVIEFEREFFKIKDFIKGAIDE